MPVKSVPSMGWTRRTAAVSVLLVLEEHRKQAGQRLVALRESKGWTQEDLAHHSKLAVKTISRFENGRHEGRGGTVRALAKALDVPEQAITGPPPAPLGLGHNAPREDDHLARIEERLERIEARLVGHDEFTRARAVELAEGRDVVAARIERQLGTIREMVAGLSQPEDFEKALGEVRALADALLSERKAPRGSAGATRRRKAS